MANSISGEPYTKRDVPAVLPDLSRWATNLRGWLSIEFGNVQRGMARAVSRTVTDDTTAGVNDGLIVADATSAPLTVTLPDPNLVGGMIVTILKADGSGNAVTIGGTVSGALNPTLATQYKAKTVQAFVPSPGDGVWLTTASV